jgi:hypothetical protein
MLAAEFDALLENAETSWLDWKRDYPAGLLGGRKDPAWQRARGEVLKDVVALANGTDGRATAYLVYGVKDLRSSRKIVGISASFDDAMFQEWAQNTFDPPPLFAYAELALVEGRVGIFSISRIAAFPHVAVQDVGDILFRGQVCYRVGTKNDVAGYEQMRAMFRGEEPFKIERTDGPIVAKIRQHYEELGRELVFPSIADRDAKLVEGYELAYYPNTRREIWAGAFRGHHEQIAMLKPPNPRV